MASTVSRLAQPITENELYIAIQPLVILYGPPDFGQDDAAAELQRAWFGLYLNALKAHPKEAIEIAVSEAIRTHKYGFPKPEVLNTLAEESSAEIRLIAFRLKKVVERAEDVKTVKRTPEETAQVREMIAGLRGADGKIRLTNTSESVTPTTNRSATADALRRLANYR